MRFEAVTPLQTAHLVSHVFILGIMENGLETAMVYWGYMVVSLNKGTPI